MFAYSDGTCASKLFKQSAFIFCSNTRLARICVRDCCIYPDNPSYEHSPHREALGFGHVGIIVKGEDTEDIVVFMDRLDKVAPLLLVVPIAVGVTV
jgi:hypothetical protein